MKERKSAAWIAKEKRKSTFHSFDWFLLVNALFSFYLFLQRLGSGHYESLNHFLRSVPAIAGVMLVAIVTYLTLRLLRSYSEKARWWGLIISVTVLSLCWCATFHHLIIMGNVTLVYPLLIGLLFASLIPFYLSPLLLCLFTVPILTMSISDNIFLRGAVSLANVFSYLLMLFLIYSAKRMLEKWFMLAIERDRENKQLIERLGKLANRDPLTGLANRRYFSNYFDSVFAGESEAQESFAVILLDVDFFKKYNDHYGHQMGDECLLRLAECFDNCVRRSQDLVARYGGEEFIILLPKSDRTEAIAVAERIKTQVAALKIPHEKSDTRQWVSVSQGIALWRVGVGREQLVEMADKALYQTKANGRNGYTLAD
ncbi:TPA: membrane-associated sensor domain-containing protein [Serratia fonticola]